jgi:hypothetical protein
VVHTRPVEKKESEPDTISSAEIRGKEITAQIIKEKRTILIFLDIETNASPV